MMVIITNAWQHCSVSQIKSQQQQKTAQIKTKADILGTLTVRLYHSLKVSENFPIQGLI